MLLEKALDDLSERGLEEIMAEGTMLLSGVDVDIRLGKPIEIGKFLQKSFILKDIASTRRIDFDDPIPSKRPMHRIALEIMFQYMSAIYGMTTVNHDHLFASLLRLIPNRKIDEMDFRQKAFLAVTMHLNQMGVYPHEDLGKDKGVGMPYLIGNRSRRTGIVLVHGYMAAPPEIKKLAEYLGKRSFLVYAPRVSGHGTSPDDLAARTRKDWMESVDEGYAIVSCLCKQVVVGGFSTGAGLALDLAARVSGVKAVFAVSPPLQLQDL